MSHHLLVSYQRTPPCRHEPIYRWCYDYQSSYRISLLEFNSLDKLAFEDMNVESRYGSFTFEFLDGLVKQY
jgi:hypothetical protein